MYSMELSFHKYVLSISVVLFTMVMTSGQVWNTLWKPLPMYRYDNGNIIYINPYYYSQFIYESYLIIMLYTMFVFGLLLLIKSYTMKSSFTTRKILVISSITFVMFLFGVIQFLFKSKTYHYHGSYQYYGYPYSLWENILATYRFVLRQLKVS